MKQCDFPCGALRVALFLVGTYVNNLTGPFWSMRKCFFIASGKISVLRFIYNARKGLVTSFNASKNCES